MTYIIPKGQPGQDYLPRGKEHLNIKEGDMMPSQSNLLYHFTERGRPNTPEARLRFKAIDAIKNRSERAKAKLGSILVEGSLMANYPYGVTEADGHRCVCFCAATDDDLPYLMDRRAHHPWGIVMNRSDVVFRGGGPVAYLGNCGPLDKLREAHLSHLAVETNGGNDWTWEQEWRIPAPGREWVRIHSVEAILIGDFKWEPPRDENGQLPALWRESPVWLWNKTKKSFTHRYPSGELLSRLQRKQEHP
ncbi:hypothetical protein [Streptomyces ginkgonis]|uniref:hypothetical protein n=1 Tax=Streptomyces ginkgonis TaxID=1812259 RepID=UPI0021769A93|nr:hypothetical protein [Streptomyces ginkgonis]